MIGRPSIPWSATASTTPPPTRPSSSAGGNAGRRPTSASPPGSSSTRSDVDGPAGLAALRQLARTADLRLPGPLVATGGGGWHHWFAPTGLGNRPPRGLAHVDWRGIGGCVLAPPSRHISGGTYRWLRVLDQAPLPEVPAALRALLDPDRATTARPAERRPGRPHPATRTAAASWPPSWPPSAGPPPASATTPSTGPRSRSTATSPAGCSTTRRSPSRSQPPPWRSGSVRPRSAAPSPRPAPPAWPTPAPSRPDPAPPARRTGHDRPLDLPGQRSRRPAARRSGVHPLLRRPASAGPGQPRAARPGLAVAGRDRRHHRGRPADRAGRQPRRRPSRLPVGAGRAVLPGLGRLQHRPRPRPPRCPTGVRHGPSRPGPHHPPAHATGRLATADTQTAPAAPSSPHPHTRTPRATPLHPSRPPAEQAAPVGARARVRAAYQAQLAAGQTPTGAGLARAAGVSERYGQRLLAEFTADPTRARHSNGDGRPATAQPTATRAEHAEGR